MPVAVGCVQVLGMNAEVASGNRSQINVSSDGELQADVDAAAAQHTCQV